MSLPMSRRSSISRRLPVVAFLAAAAGAGIAFAFPEPSPYPITWEIKLEVATPKRVVIDGKAYWYLTYNVTNNTKQERVYLPIYEVLTPNGKVTRADRLIPLNVVKAIKNREGIKFLEQANEIAGEIRLGEDQTRDGVTIWPEASPDDRSFTVFATGFSGETAKVPGPDGKDLTLYKALKLDYLVPGDPKFRDINPIQEVGRSYVMR
jgi:hypothetical protein